MAIIDDIKKKTEEGFKTLKETAQDIAFNVEKQAKIGKKKYVDISKIQKNIHRLNAEIGEYVYDQFTSNRTLSLERPFLKDRVSAITRLKLEIKDLEDEIEVIKGTQPPKREDYI